MRGPDQARSALEARAAAAAAKMEAAVAKVEVALAAGRCIAGHTLETVPADSIPQEYIRDMICDLCEKSCIRLRKPGMDNFHCAQCGFDACSECQQKVHIFTTGTVISITVPNTSTGAARPAAIIAHKHLHHLESVRPVWSKTTDVSTQEMSLCLFTICLT